ncbi:TPA: hypothetical protein QH064_005051 [Klebsiella pneumoniae subsp. pneumoniae]|nr:hypothetical protein [Salmonella enterica]HDS4694752.1 hypothetical protein [Klebsiella pneumoniae subsp. pneumoniae]EJA5114982.1 hypothetical protein [Salmonella enterica]EJA5740847.1 hypothetical protein [Salmonella enterica]EJA5754888.1 hypothetical protein [Salmonella enterica]
MNNLEKYVEELEEFDRSIRHLPHDEQRRLRKYEYERRKINGEITKKVLLTGLVSFIPALVWFAVCWYDNSVYTNLRTLLLTMLISPFMMLVSEIFLKQRTKRK